MIIFTLPDGFKYEGVYQEGDRHGRAIVTLGEKGSFRAIYEKGKLIGSLDRKID